MNERGSRAIRWPDAVGPLVALLAAACAGGASGGGPSPATHEPDEVRAAATRPSAAGGGAEEPESRGDIPVWEDGRQTGFVTPALARERGLTVVDLGDAWAPGVFREDPSLGPAGHQPYRAELVRLQNEDTRRARRDPTERYLELFGIFPTFDVLRARLADDERHACHEAIDDAPIEALEDSLRPRRRSVARRQARRAVWLRNRLERVARRRRLDSVDELEEDGRWGRQLRRLRDLEATVDAVRAVQAHLDCEGFLQGRWREGVLDGWTARAIRAWQKKHMIISLASRLDEATRATLATESRELDFRSLLRSLRERVVDATGVIEDGSASNDWGTVLGRQLQVDDEFRWVDRLDPLPNGAPDLVSRHTEAAARALGWTDPAAARAWLEAHHPERADEHLVALPLPPAPDYHAEHMDLRAEIDRGDVWYTFPYTDDGRPRGFPVRRRPTLTIYARGEDGTEHALVRWNTTIGGWQPEVNPEGGVGMRYKESDVGPRVWRDLIASPAWLPPPSTPDEELLRGRPGRWRVNTSITGPGYDSAYGLAMVIHHLVRDEGTEDEEWRDRGIRSHGSVSYRSILRGHSHGCHRLFNHLAVRMTSFLLAHRHHEVRGRLPASLRRELWPPPPEPAAGEEPSDDGAEDETAATDGGGDAPSPAPERRGDPLVLEIDTRGYLFELTPPVPVEVLRGRVRGRPSRAPAGFYPLPEELQAQAREQIEEDPGPE